MNKFVLFVSVILVVGLNAGCATTKETGSSTGGGALGTADNFGLIGESNAKKARKVAEFLVGKGEGNPVKGWDYDSGIRYVGEQPLIKNGEARPQDFEAWAQYSRTWRPFDGILVAPAGVPAKSDVVTTSTNSVLWKDTGELANALEAMFNAIDAEEGAK